MSSEREGILVISCCILPAEDVILQILGAETLPGALINNPFPKGYLWSFQTKYYSAEVNLYALEEKVSLDPAFLSTIRAVVFYFNTQKQSSFSDVLSWLPFLKDIDADVQLLVSNNCSEESICPDLEKKTVLSWCIENQYELVELNTQPESDDEDENSYNDATGYERVIQALQSHTWSNLVMKNENTESDTMPTSTIESNSTEKSGQPAPLGTGDNEAKKDGSSNNLVEDEGQPAPLGVGDNDAKKNCSSNNLVEDEELQREEKWLDNVLNGEDPGGESFEALFTRFASLKEKAAGLSGDQRKKYAEKVSIAFWRAMGGDEDEIDGLDEEE